jgi:hypothetical protein
MNFGVRLNLIGICFFAVRNDKPAGVWRKEEAEWSRFDYFNLCHPTKLMISSERSDSRARSKNQLHGNQTSARMPREPDGRIAENENVNESVNSNSAPFGGGKNK